MPYEYDDPVTQFAIDTAVDLAIGPRGQGTLVPFEERVKRAVRVAFCFCVTDAADASAGGTSPVHEGVVAEVTRLARIRMELAAQSPAPEPDPVEVASADSFPASDPPAWIWR